MYRNSLVSNSQSFQQMEFLRWPPQKSFGREPRDVTIILVAKGGSRSHNLALVHLHSNVLITHSKYFHTCLSERWENPASPIADFMEFVLEAQTDVRHYFNCFSNMYSPLAKTFESVEYGVELLKVASQIDFQPLLERISLYLSCTLWTKEDEIRVRQYASSEDFPRVHVTDLVVRLGLDEQSEEDRRKQLVDLVREYSRAAFNAASSQGLLLPDFLKDLGGSDQPSKVSTWIFAIISEEAKSVFVNIGKEWNHRIAVPGHSNPAPRLLWKLKAMCWILEAFLTTQVAEELVKAIVHIDAIPKYLMNSARIDNECLCERMKLANLVLLMYQEVAAGRLLLRPPERFALLANWRELMKKYVVKSDIEQATTNLFLTLPVKVQTKFIKLHNAEAFDFIRPVPLFSLLQSRGELGELGE